MTPGRCSSRWLVFSASRWLVAAWRALPRAPLVSCDRLVGELGVTRRPVRGEGDGDGGRRSGRAIGRDVIGSRPSSRPLLPGSRAAGRLGRAGHALANGDARKPVQHRRGPATVTGASLRSMTPLGNREGERRPEARRPLRSRHHQCPPGGGTGGLMSRISPVHLPRSPSALLALPPAGGTPGSVTVVDDAGDSVAVRTPATRVVSLIPATTELLFAIGAGGAVVGRTEWCDYPPAAAAVPNLGPGINPNVEAVARRPSRSRHPLQLGPACRSRVPAPGRSASPRCGSTPTPWRMCPASAALLGRLTGHEARGRLACARCSIPRSPPRPATPPPAPGPRCCCWCGSSRP